MALRWIQQFETSEHALDACLYLLQMNLPMNAVVFGVLKLVAQRVFMGWSSLISF